MKREEVAKQLGVSPHPLFASCIFIPRLTEDGELVIMDGNGCTISDETARALREACAHHLAASYLGRLPETDGLGYSWSSPPIEQREKGNRRRGFVYVMKNTRNGLTKIGFSNNPEHRERTLQSEEPEVELVSHWSGTMGDERELHQRFAEFRVRGEWFNLPAGTEISNAKSR